MTIGHVKGAKKHFTELKRELNFLIRPNVGAFLDMDEEQPANDPDVVRREEKVAHVVRYI